MNGRFRNTSCGCVLGLVIVSWIGSACSEESVSRWDVFSEQTVSQLRRLEDPLEQVEVIKQFAREDYAESAEYLVELLSDRKVSAIAKSAIADVLGRYQSESARAKVKEAVGTELEQNSYLLRAYIAHGDQDARKLLLNLARDGKTPRVQVLAIEGLHHIGEPGEIPVGYWEALIKWVEDPETFHGIRVAAARALSDWEDYHAVATLMGQLDDPLLRGVSRDGLTRLTGETYWDWNYGWKGWWKENEGDYVPEPLADEAYELMLCSLGEAAREDLNEDDPDFFGIKITGRNILFILDCSGSMYTENRLARLQDELSAMIAQLHEGYQFGLLLFPQASIPGRDYGQATDRHIERMQEFVQSMTADGLTPMGEAIFHAYHRIVPREEVDTIYLLSDGVPSDTSLSFLMNEMAGHYEEHQVTVNTIFIGEEPVGRKLMKDVAGLSAGRFIHVP